MIFILNVIMVILSIASLCMIIDILMIKLIDYQKNAKFKKEVNFIYQDFLGLRIRGRLILVKTLKKGDLFISTYIYGHCSGTFPITLMPANEDDVNISKNSGVRYYVFRAGAITNKKSKKLIK